MVVDIFCKIKGFDGESTDETYQQWIKALSYNYGLSQLISRVGA
jgi:type VI protein secretion system component Hcp